MVGAAAAPARPSLRAWLVLAGVLGVGAGGTALGLERWRASIEARWSAHDAALPIGSRREAVLSGLGPPTRFHAPGTVHPATGEAWAYVIATRGDCGETPDAPVAFSRAQGERGRSFLEYREGFPASQTHLFVFDSRSTLVCAVVVGR